MLGTACITLGVNAFEHLVNYNPCGQKWHLFRLSDLKHFIYSSLQ